MKRNLVRLLRAGGLATALALLASPGLAAHTGGDVDLRGYDGAVLDPAGGQPYSPKQTCSATAENGVSGCHAVTYDTITAAYHFQQGFDQVADDFNPDKPWVKSPGMYGKW